MLVSVIIPCYNQGTFLNEALESVFNQVFLDWECIVVDDGSTDDSKVICQKWIDRDERFKYIYQNNSGVSSARNLGIENANGSFIQFLDSDDLLHNSKIQLSLDALSLPENKEVKIVISNFETISNDSEEITAPFCVLNERFFNVQGFLTEWNFSFSVQIQCGFFESSLFENIRFPENLSAQEDWVVWVLLFKLHNKCVFIDKPLAYYRINPESRMMTLGIDDNQLKAVICFKDILSFEEYFDFSYNLISRYYQSDFNFRNKLIEAKRSNSYQTGFMIKKVFKSVGLLQFSKRIFKLVLKFKAK